MYNELIYNSSPSPSPSPSPYSPLRPFFISNRPSPPLPFPYLVFDVAHVTKWLLTVNFLSLWIFRHLTTDFRKGNDNMLPEGGKSH